MPFVSDIAGPQQPVTTWPPLLPGALRRTSTIDTHPDPDPAGQAVDLRARDVRSDPSGTTDVVVIDHVGVRAHLTDRVIDAIDGIDGRDARLVALRGTRVGPGFRGKVSGVLGSDVARSTLLNLLLDDWAGASLVTGYGSQHAAITNGSEESMPKGAADRMAGICSGFAPDASFVDFTRRNLLMACVRGPRVPPTVPTDETMHPVEPLRAHGMRRMRRLDVHPGHTEATFDAHFRDSHVDESGVETIVHEYTVVGVVALSTRTITSVVASARVLPWQECPGALGSAARVRGMTLGELRNRIRTEFVGTSTCTHLNDTLRALGDLGALIDAHQRTATSPATVR